MLEENLYRDKAVYASYLIDDNEVLKSSSGGIATAMARHVISHGGKVAGVAYSEDFMTAEYVLIDEIKDVDRLRGSKVISVIPNGIFNKIEENLEKCQVLFFGLPCMVAALRSYLKKDFDNLILCELICSGRVSSRVHKDYCNYLCKKYHSQIISFTIRGKDSTWLPEMMKVGFANGKEFKFPFKRTEYGQAFKILKEEACLKCKHKGNGRQGDLMIGDFWGATPADPFWNDKGVSVVLCETNKGVVFFSGIKDVCKYETTFSRAVEGNPSVVRATKKHKERDFLMGTFRNEGLFPAMKKSETMKHIRLTNVLEKIPFYSFLKQIRKLV